jgi:hypothetical protein
VKHPKKCNPKWKPGDEAFIRYEIAERSRRYAAAGIPPDNVIDDIEWIVRSHHKYSVKNGLTHGQHHAMTDASGMLISMMSQMKTALTSAGNTPKRSRKVLRTALQCCNGILHHKKPTVNDATIDPA